MQILSRVTELKVYNVIVEDNLGHINSNGRMLPMEIVCEDGRKYQIDKVLASGRLQLLRPAVKTLPQTITVRGSNCLKDFPECGYDVKVRRTTMLTELMRGLARY